MRPLDRLRVAERPGEVDVGAMEVERLGDQKPIFDPWIVWLAGGGETLSGAL